MTRPDGLSITRAGSSMFLEYFDLKWSAWDAEILTGILTRLQDHGYHGLIYDVHQVLGRFARPRADRSLAAFAQGDGFTDVVIPPAQPHTRVFLHSLHPDVLRVVVVGRSQREVRLAVTAVKGHLEAKVGSHIDDMITDEGDHSSLTKFRRDLLPGLGLAGEGGPGVEVRNALSTQLLMAMERQPVIRGKHTLLASQAATLAPERSAEQAKEALEQLVAAGTVERWNVVVCRDGGQWLAVSPSVEDMRKFASLNLECPHCGKRVSKERSDIAYRLGGNAAAHLPENRWMCEAIDTALRQLGVEAVATQAGAGPVDGAAWYYGAVILFRAKAGSADRGDLTGLQEQARRLEGEGWKVFPLLISDRPASPEVKGAGVTVIEGLSGLDGALDGVLKDAAQRNLNILLPPLLHPAVIPLADLLPVDQRES